MYDNTKKKKEEDLIDDDVFNRAIGMVRQNSGSNGSLGAQKNAALNAYLNRGDFSYDINTDALYKQYKDKYIQQGQQAMQDTMGQAAALTGGYGSSYAQNVGQQAYNSHLQQLNDVVPELYQMAYDRYKDEGEELLQRYALLSDEEREAYARQYQEHRDDVTDNQWQQSFDHQVNQDNISNQQWQQSFDHQVNQDNISNQKWQQSFDHQVSQDNISNQRYDDELAREDQEDRAMALAYAGDYSGYAQLHGMTNEEAKSYFLAAYGTAQEEESNAESYTYAYTDPETNRRHYYNSEGDLVEFDDGINPYNGDVADDVIEAMQMSLGVPVTGTWDQKSQSAAKATWGVSSADEAARHYQAMSDNVPYYDENADTSYFKDFTAGDWEAYFAAIRIDSGVAAAEEELNLLTRTGVIPADMVNSAAIGARGGQKGH